MIQFHAVLLDETRCEFGADIEAETREEAYAELAESYPESCVVQLETLDESLKRENDMYEHISRGGDWDDEGRPIFGADYEYDEDDE